MIPIIHWLPSTWQQRLSQFLPANSLRTRFARGAFWSLIGTAAAQAMNLLCSVVTARLLGKTGFGELGMVLSTMGLFGIFAGLGLGLTTTKYVAEFRTRDPARAGRIIRMSSGVALLSGAITSMVFYFLSSYLASHAIAAPHLVGELQVACLLLFFTALNGAQMGPLAGFESFRLIAQLNLAQGILALPLTVAGVYYWQLPGAVWSRTAAVGLGCLINHLALRREARRMKIPLAMPELREELPLLWRFSFPAVLAGAMTAPAMWVANTFLVNRPNGYAEMGIFSAANQWRTALAFFPTVLSQTTTPMLANILGQGAKRSALKLMFAAIAINGLILLLAGVGLGLFSPWIMTQYGKDFREGWPVMVLCLIAAGLTGVISQLGNFIVASARMWPGFLTNVGQGLALIISAWALSSRGAWGLALAYVITYFAHLLWTTAYVYFGILNRNLGEVSQSGESPKPGPAS